MRLVGKWHSLVALSASVAILLVAFQFVFVTSGQRLHAATTSSRIGLGYGIIAGSQNYDLVQSMGFNWIKLDISWKSVERSRGSYNWTGTDESVRLARSRGFSILMRIDDSPQWASNSPEHNAPPVNDNDLADFMYQLALRYRGQVQAYEIWNEPNIAIEWGWQNPDPAKFARMLKALYPRVKQADPNAVVVTGGLSNTGDGNGGSVLGDLLYIKLLYDPNEDGNLSDGAKGFFDAIGSHPYGGPYPPDQDPWSPNMGTYFRRAWQHHQMAEVWGGEDRQIWATEFGWLLDPATDGLNCDSNPNFGYHFAMQKVSESQQAENLVGAFQYALANWPWMGPMFLMSLDTATNSYRAQCEAIRFFGILRSDGSPRLAYTRLSQMAKLPMAALSTSSTATAFLLRPSDPETTSMQVQIGNAGAGLLSWTVTSSAGWLGVSPGSGYAPSTLTITVNKATLPQGWTTGTVTITSSAGVQTINVSVYVGDVKRVYLPAAIDSAAGP
ncbi:MAG: cellulase family glycosylhydrolase [Chloroflexi bacterium]|nr:cellulase family glycosylhydrolase [Chloroflexota bacterium]